MNTEKIMFQLQAKNDALDARIRKLEKAQKNTE